MGKLVKGLCVKCFLANLAFGDFPAFGNAGRGNDNFCDRGVLGGKEHIAADLTVVLTLSVSVSICSFVGEDLAFTVGAGLAGIKFAGIDIIMAGGGNAFGIGCTTRASINFCSFICTGGRVYGFNICVLIH